MLRKMLAATVLSILLIGGSGCGNIKGFGVGRWPVYSVPADPALSEADKADLVEFAKAKPELFGKIHGQFLAYRKIVQEHNKKAKEVNRRQLEALGYEKGEIESMLPKESSP